MPQWSRALDHALGVDQVFGQIEFLSWATRAEQEVVSLASQFNTFIKTILAVT